MAAGIWKSWTTAAVLALAAALGTPASAQQEQETPGRAARLSQPDGGVQWAGADGNWQAVDANWPLTGGDRIRVAAGSRAELHAGAHALRLQGPAELSIDALDEDDMRLTLEQGSLNLRVRDMAPDERIEVNTQNLAMLLDQSGEFRVDVEPDSTRVAARAGTALLYGENGESTTLAPAQQARYVGRNLSATTVQGAGPRDALDQWAADRGAAEDRSPSAQYLSREVLGYQELDAHGEWSNTAEFGTVWYPRTTIAGWEPYRHGQWRWVDPWGWTWFDDARWGFAPFHYGRWTRIGPRWAWVPGPRGPRPIYAPALVGFAGTPAPRPPDFGQHRTPGTNWVPLAPGQAWRPGFHAGPRDPDRDHRGPPPLRSTLRERPPGPTLATPAPGMQPGRADQERRERWQREQESQQQQRRQRSQDQSRDELQQRHEQNRQEQQQRLNQAQQQQRTLQEQQSRQMDQLRQQQNQQQRELQEPQRRQERFMREQRDRMEQREPREQREQRQDRPPRAAPPQERRESPGGRGGDRSERGGRPGNRD